jgi:hypothetical protein
MPVQLLGFDRERCPTTPGDEGLGLRMLVQRRPTPTDHLPEQPRTRPSTEGNKRRQTVARMSEIRSLRSRLAALAWPEAAAVRKSTFHDTDGNEIGFGGAPA